LLCLLLAEFLEYHITQDCASRSVEAIYVVICYITIILRDSGDIVLQLEHRTELATNGAGLRASHDVRMAAAEC